MNYESKLQHQLYESGILPQLASCSSFVTAQAAAGLTQGGISALVLEDGVHLSQQLEAIRTHRPDMLIGVSGRDTGDMSICEQADFCFVQADSADLYIGRDFVIPVCGSLSQLEAQAAQGKTTAAVSSRISLDAVRGLNQRFPQLRLIIEVGPEDSEAYLKEPNVLAVRNYSILTQLPDTTQEEIAQRANDAMNRAYRITTGHLGINTENREEAVALANQLSALFGTPWRETAKSFLVGDLVEVMKMPYLGQKGHMGFLTNDLQRSIRFYQTKGAAFNMATYEKNAIVYFAQEYAGVAFHLTQRPNDPIGEVL